MMKPVSVTKPDNYYDYYIPMLANPNCLESEHSHLEFQQEAIATVQV